ncbi:MAG: hypothetical protein GXX93_11600 [Anaerolineae bacterium]|nr:hypothetical protein [Anaerolineae bacterium]
MDGSSRRVYSHVPSDRSWEAFRDFITGFRTALLGDAAEEEDISDEEWKAKAARFWSAVDGNHKKDEEGSEQQNGD